MGCLFGATRMPLRGGGASVPLSMPKEASERSEGGMQYSWCNRTTGNQLTAWKPEEGWWPKDRPPAVNNYQCGLGWQCRSALSQQIVPPVQTVNPFWKQNLGKGFLSIFGQMTTWPPCNSPWFRETAGLGFHLPSTRKWLRGLFNLDLLVGDRTREG